MEGAVDLWLNRIHHDHRKDFSVRVANPAIVGGGWDGQEMFAGNDIQHSAHSIENSGFGKFIANIARYFQVHVSYPLLDRLVGRSVMMTSPESDKAGQLA